MDDNIFDKYVDGLDELEKACLNERQVNADYYKKLRDDLNKGLKDNSSFCYVTLDSLNEIVRVMSFCEIMPEVLRGVCDNHGLKCISKTKTVSIDMNGPVYTYFFISSKRKFCQNVLCDDLTKVDDSGVIFNLLDEKEFRSIKKDD